ncbi:MAG: PD40 domain-containing protein, partial [Chitinophagaceae bacterium]|nr:PD40 domain-containing protein [Chitinophagaceae bacterium]
MKAFFILLVTILQTGHLPIPGFYLFRDMEDSITQSMNTKPVYYFNPSWSPDGKKILFESTMNGESAIYSLSKDGKDLFQITRDPSGQPSWSPDGRSIVYYRNIDGRLQLFINSATGGNERRLLTSQREDYGASWSKRGVIAFMSNLTKDHISHEIFTINSDGSKLKRITDSLFDCMNPGWSPDGLRLVYERSVWTSKTYANISEEEMNRIKSFREISIMNADGSNAYAITDARTAYENPVWSSDGKAIFLSTLTDSTSLIHRYETN